MAVPELGSLSFPLAGATGAQELAVAASHRLNVGNDVQILTPDGRGFAHVGNAGAGETVLGVQSQVGSVDSSSKVSVLDRAKVYGDVRSGAAVFRGNDTTVTGTVSQFSSPALGSLDHPIRLSESVFEAVSLEPEQGRELEPGSYPSATLKRASWIRLKPGVYYFGRLDLQADSRLLLDNASGPIEVYVGDALTFQASIEATSTTPAAFLMAYLGTGTARVERPFTGTLIAPNGSLWVGSCNKALHKGAFLAKALEIEPNARIQHAPLPWWLIRKVVVDDPHICPGEPFRVALDTSPGAAGAAVTPALSGIVGSERWYTFDKPGKYPVTAGAIDANGYADSQTTEITVADDCAEVWPRLEARLDPSDPLRVEFKVANAAEFAGTATYEWDFGDGYSSDESGSVSHSYSVAMGNSVYQKFPVKLSVSPSGDGSGLREARTEVVLWSYPGYLRSKGYVGVDLAPNGTLAAAGGTASVRLRNPAAETASFTAMRLQHIYCNGQDTTGFGAEVPVSITIGGRQSRSETINVGTLPAGVCQVGVHLSGTAGTLQATSNGYITVRDAYRQRAQLSPEMQAAIQAAVDQGLVRDPGRITDNELAALMDQGKFELPVAPFSNEFHYYADPNSGDECSQGEASFVHPEHGLLECAPSENPADREYLYAYAVNARAGHAVHSPGGAEGLIGGLLVSVDPPEFWSHTGVMTTDHFHLRHSTMHQDRIIDTVTAAYSKLDPDQIAAGEGLRYGWPGSIDQSVGQAFLLGSLLTPPEGGGQLKMKAFSVGSKYIPTDDRVQLAPPLVVKADPFLEATHPEIRGRALAMVARAQEVQSYYSFYSYSQGQYDPGFGLDGDPNADLTWAEGRRGAMCSGHVWKAMFLAGEGMLPALCQPGVACPDELPSEFGPGSPEGDGLFVYTRDERLRAGEALHDRIRKMAAEDWKAWATGRADNAANQIVNCFAVGNCVSNDDWWRDVDPGHAASPDALLQWRSANDGGLFGFAEVLNLQTGVYVPKYRWRPSTEHGVIEGHVFALDPLTHEATPIEGAQIMADGHLALTNASGYYSVVDVTAGSTFITANATIKFDPNDPNSGSMPAANFVTVEVLPGATVTAPDMYLELPSDDVLAAFRHTIHITGSMKVEAEMTNKLRMQYETCTFDVSLPVYPYGMQDPAIPATINDATGNNTVTSGSAAGGQPTATLSCKEANGSPDVKTVLKLTFRMQDGYALRVDARHELYEQSGDLEDDASWSVDIPLGSVEDFPKLNLENPEYGDKDSGHLSNFKVTYCKGEAC